MQKANHNKAGTHAMWHALMARTMKFVRNFARVGLAVEIILSYIALATPTVMTHAHFLERARAKSSL